MLRTMGRWRHGAPASERMCTTRLAGVTAVHGARLGWGTPAWMRPTDRPDHATSPMSSPPPVSPRSSGRNLEPLLAGAARGGSAPLGPWRSRCPMENWWGLHRKLRSTYAARNATPSVACWRESFSGGRWRGCSSLHGLPVRSIAHLRAPASSFCQPCRCLPWPREWGESVARVVAVPATAMPFVGAARQAA